MEDAVAGISRELAVVNRQKARLHELLEIGEYDLQTYRERMAAVKEKLADMERRLAEAQLRLDQAKTHQPAVQAAKIRAVLDAYWLSDTPHKNALLHSVVEVITYRKEKKTKPSELTLDFILKSL